MLATIFQAINCEAAGVEDEWIGRASWPTSRGRWTRSYSVGADQGAEQLQHQSQQTSPQPTAATGSRAQGGKLPRSAGERGDVRIRRKETCGPRTKGRPVTQSGR